MRILITFIFLILLPLSGMGQNNSLTLNETIEIALENNFQLKQAKNNLALNETRIRSAQADFLPNLNASLSGNQNVGRQFIQEDATFEDRTTYGVSGGLSASVTLFSGFQNINSLRQSRANYQQQQANLERIRENIIFNTAMRYLQVMLDIELLEIAEQNVETSRMQLEQVSAQVEVGARPTVDLYQQESILANNELQVVQAENALNISKTRLIRMLQIEIEGELELSLPDFDDAGLQPMQVDLEDMIAAALANRKDLEAQQLQIQSSRYNLDIARANRYPTVSASAGINSRYSDQYRIPDPATGTSLDVSFGDQFFDQMISRSVGFSISIPIFNRWNTNTNIHQAQIQYRNAELSLQDIQFEIREEIRQAYNDYISLVKELEATERSLRAAERTFETQQQRYEIGATTLIELNQATTDYMEAMSNRQRVIYNFIFQEKLLDYYIGRLGDEISL